MMNITKGRGILLFACTVLGLLIGSLFFGQPNTSPDVPSYDPYAATEDQLCIAGGEGVVLSPTGKYAIFDQGIYKQTSVTQQGRRIAILDISCAVSLNSVQQCLIGMEGFESVRALAWARDEQSLFLIENNKNILRLEFFSKNNRTSARIQERIPLPNRNIGLTVMRLGYTKSISANDENESLKHGWQLALKGQNPQNHLPFGLFIDSNGSSGAFLEDQRNLQLHFATNGIIKSIPIKSRELQTARLTTELNLPTHKIRDFYVVDSGILISTRDGDTTIPFGWPFVKPIISSYDGGVLGWFNKSEVKTTQTIDHGENIQGELKRRLAVNQGYFIHSVSITKTGEFAYILKDIDGRKEIGISKNGHTIRKYCHSGHDRITEKGRLTIRDIEIGETSRPLFGTLITQEKNRGLVVFFGGGPLNNTENYAYSIRQYLRFGWDVLAVNYSGSVGTGSNVSGRLYSEGMSNALILDAEKVSTYLNKIYRDREIIIHGESFGALPAIAVDKYINYPHRLILIAPFLRHQPPEKWANKNKTMAKFFGKVNIEFQKRFEAAIIGKNAEMPSGLQAEQNDILRLLSSQTHVLSIFGQDDYMSSEEHIPEFWKNDTLTVKTISGIHDFITTQAETWKLINSWININYQHN